MTISSNRPVDSPKRSDGSPRRSFGSQRRSEGWPKKLMSMSAMAEEAISLDSAERRGAEESVPVTVGEVEEGRERDSQRDGCSNAWHVIVILDKSISPLSHPNVRHIMAYRKNL